uniref:Reverse transcriptase domain-containing protein n=1 Tax=Sander lucioperca TaxID=283035 RepID=A0A8D0AY71_SANLU
SPSGGELGQGVGQDSGHTLGTMRIPSWSWNNGPARKDPGGSLGVCPCYMCFVDLEKAYDWVPREILWKVLREYGVRGSLLRAIQSLYDQSESWVQVLRSKSDLFQVRVGLRQGYALSPILFVIFMDRISRRS